MEHRRHEANPVSAGRSIPRRRNGGRWPAAALCCALLPLLALGQESDLVVPAAEAEEPEVPWYKIELLVVQNLDSRTQGDEDFRRPLEFPIAPLADPAAEDAIAEDDPSTEIHSDAGTVLPEAEAVTGEPGDAGEAALTGKEDTESLLAEKEPVRFFLLTEEHFSLTEFFGHIRRSAGFRPLLHFAWAQPGYPREEAFDIMVDTFFDAAETHITGRARLYRSRYLHLRLDLEFHEDDQGFQVDEGTTLYSMPLGGWMQTTVDRYLLEESRRMRSNELHYFDHPRFGVIALISPIEKSELLPVEAGQTEEPVIPPAGESTPD